MKIFLLFVIHFTLCLGLPRLYAQIHDIPVRKDEKISLINSRDLPSLLNKEIIAIEPQLNYKNSFELEGTDGEDFQKRTFYGITKHRIGRDVEHVDLENDVEY